jgi:F-type H+-transporting ATPase subunit epsilon
MSEKAYKLEIVTPEKKACSLEAVFSVFPGSEGELGILADHAPLLARLVPGEVRITRPGAAAGMVERFAIAGGFLEVRNNQVSVLAETAEAPADIDKGAALKAKADAEEALKMAATEAEKAAAGLQLRKALARIKVAESAPAAAPASV